MDVQVGLWLQCLGDWSNAVGTGPFIITDWASAVGATYTRNPDYWGETTIDGKTYQTPFVDQVIYPIIPDESTRVSALRTGKIDWYLAVPPDYSPTLTSTSPKLVLDPYYKSQVNILYMKTAEKPWTDRNVRRAMMMALDYKTIQEVIYPYGGAVHCFPVDSRSPYYTPIDELPEETRMLFEYHPDEAKRLIAAAGYPNGFKVDIATPTTDFQAEVLDYVTLCTTMWEAIGLDCTISVTDSATLRSMWGTRAYKDMAGREMVTTTPTIFVPGATSISSTPYWYDDKLDKMYLTAMATFDDAERTKMLKDICVYYTNEVPVIPGVLQELRNAYWPWVQNYYGELESGYYNHHGIISTLWIDETMKKEMGY